jgi:hypothetical protein
MIDSFSLLEKKQLIANNVETISHNFTESLVKSEYEAEVANIETLKKPFAFKLSSRIKNLRLGTKETFNRHVDPFEEFSKHESE